MDLLQELFDAESWENVKSGTSVFTVVLPNPSTMSLESANEENDVWVDCCDSPMSIFIHFKDVWYCIFTCLRHNDTILIADEKRALVSFLYRDVDVFKTTSLEDLEKKMPQEFLNFTDIELAYHLSIDSIN